MQHDEYQAHLRRQRETVGRRLDTIRANLAELETEYEELEVALRVHDRISGDAAKARKSGAERKSNPPQEYTIFLILDEAIPNSLSTREICRIAKDKHGREIPVTSAGSLLSYAKKKGKVINRNGTWSTNPDDFNTSGETSPEVPLSDGRTSAEASPAQRPVERSNHGSSSP